MKKFKLISLAAAGVVAATAVTASAALPLSQEDIARRECRDNLVDQLHNGEIECAHPDNRVLGEDGLTDMERELENILTEHPVSTVTIDENEFSIMLAANNTSMALEEVNNTGVSYKLWSKTFEVPDAAFFSSKFSGPNYFVPAADKNGCATLEARSGYEGLYLTVSSRTTYKKSDGTIVHTRDSQEGNASSYEAAPEVIKKATLTAVDLYFYMNDGTGSSTPYREVAVVHIVQKN